MPTLAQVIIMAAIKYGPEAVDYIVNLWKRRDDPTPEDIAKLKSIIAKPGEDYFK